MELSDYRKRLDEIDEELLKLFSERMNIAAEIASWKQENSLPVLDARREKEKLRRIEEMSDPELSGILEVISSAMKVDKEQAREMFLAFFCVAHGLASLLANNSMEYDEAQCRKMLENVFFGMAAAKSMKGN